MKKEAKALFEGDKKFVEVARRLNKSMHRLMKVNTGIGSDEKYTIASLALETAYKQITSMIEYIALENQVSNLNEDQKEALKELLNK